MNSSTSLTKPILPRPPRNNQEKRGRGVFLLFLLDLLFFGACGIPEYYFIHPVEDITLAQASLGSTQFFFTHNPKNASTVFEGYYFFYRFFSLSSLPEGIEALTYLNERADKDFSSASIRNMKKEPYSTSVLYRPLHLFSDDVFENCLQIPSSSREEAFLIEIDFSETINFYGPSSISTNEPEERTFTLYRRELDDPESPAEILSYFTFTPNDFIPGHTDMPATIYSSEDDQLNMALFVVPYGHDPVTLSEVFGEASSLGYIRLNFRY